MDTSSLFLLSLGPQKVSPRYSLDFCNRREDEKHSATRIWSKTIFILVKDIVGSSWVWCPLPPFGCRAPVLTFFLNSQPIFEVKDQRVCYIIVVVWD